MNQGILISFGLLVSLILILKQKGLRQIKIIPVSPRIRIIGIAIMLITLCLGLRVLYAPSDISSVTAFWTILLAGTAFLLSQIKWPSEIIQVLLLFLSVLATNVFNQGLSANSLCPMLLGLIIYKLTDIYLLNSDNNFQDILPASVWLCTMAWADLLGKQEAPVGNTLLLCLSLNLILNFIPPSLLSPDKFFAKRILLSIFAGLALLISFKLTLLQSNLMVLAGLFAAGKFFSYFFDEAISEDQTRHLLLAMSYLVSMGILTLVSTRLLGDIGVAVLAAASCTATSKSLFAALFWSSRLLIQGFVLHNVTNVTGINLMHPYCSAALFFGFLSVLFLSLILHINTKLWLSLAAILVMGLLAPPAIIYLIHEESTASFLIAANVVAISLISFAGLIYRETDLSRQSNLMLMPLILSSSSIIFATLIEVGNQATVASRLQVISYAIAVLVVIYLILSNIKRVARNPV